MKKNHTERNPKLYLEEIIECIQRIEEYTNELTRETFLKNQLIIDAVDANLEFINVDEGIVQAQTLIGKYKLSPRDSIHIASVLNKRAKTILSDDEDFEQINESNEHR